jgi:hypothetical protein
VNVSIYQLIVVAHVLVAFSTIALMAIGLFVLARARRASTTREVGLWLSGSAMAAQFLAFGALLLLLSGVYLAWDRWGLGSGWLEVSAATLLLIMLAGFASRAPDGRNPSAWPASAPE